MDKEKYNYPAPFKALMAIMLVLSLGLGQGVAEENQGGYMDPMAMDVLRNVSDHLGRANTFSVKATALYDDVMASGVIVTYAKDVEVFVKRPDKFMAIVTDDDRRQRRIYFDGKSIVRFNVEKNTYQRLVFEGDIDAVLDHIIDNYDLSLPLADFISNDIAGVMKSSIISAEHMGERMVGGVPCHHLSFESTGADWQLWVQKWDTPIPRRFTINYVTIDEHPQYLGMFKEWRINPEIDEQIFTFRPPAGAKEVALKQSVGSKTVQ